MATVVFLCLFFVSCNSTQSRIDSVKKQIENAEENLDDFSEKEWNRLVSDMKELKNDYVKNKKNYYYHY
jgi:PBP1b-binding outer membrane lipoprotein LpoB